MKEELQEIRIPELKNQGIVKNIFIKEGAQIAKALIKFQSECVPIEKTKQGYGYKYADLASVVKCISPVLGRCGLSFVQLLGGDATTVTVETIILHESGEAISSSVSSSVVDNKGKSMTPIQAMGSVITYLKRYALTSSLGVVCEEDSDGAYNPINKSNQSHANKQEVKQRIKAIQPATSTNPEKDALDNLGKSVSLDDLKTRFKSLGLQMKNPAVVSFKDIMKLKFEDL